MISLSKNSYKIFSLILFKGNEPCYWNKFPVIRYLTVAHFKNLLLWLSRLDGEQINPQSYLIFKIWFFSYMYKLLLRKEKIRIFYLLVLGYFSIFFYRALLLKEINKLKNGQDHRNPFNQNNIYLKTDM